MPDNSLTESPRRDRLSREARLALALARHRPSDAHLAHARHLVAEGIDWPRLHKLAVRNNVVPLLTANLEVAQLPGVPGEAVALLARARDRVRLRAMVLLSRQLSLINKILIPRAIRFALIKGVGLSQRHYGDPFARHSQDIDLLVDAARIAEVASALVDQGWAVVNPAWRGHPLDVFARFNSVTEMQSPEGVRVELHRTLDNSGLVFDSTRLLEGVASLTILGRPLPALAAIDEFLYVCFHHSRHGWSCLHWCADLPAMMGAPDFESRVLARVGAHALMRSTVSACLLLADDLDKLGAGASPSELPRPSPFLDACLQSIDLETTPPPLPVDFDPTVMEPDFPQPWQRSVAYRACFAISRCRPNLNDYDAMPLPEHLQWVYWFTRPWRALMRRLVFRSRGAG